MRGQKKTTSDYHMLASKRGFRWLENQIPSSVRINTQWRCAAGHEWKASFCQIQSGRGCPECYLERRRKHPNDYQVLAIERGFKWLGPKVQNIQTKTFWECQYGHQWEARYADIKHRKSGCPFCSQKARKAAEDYRSLAVDRGFSWIGKLPKNNRSKTLWECSQGHKWRSTYYNISAGWGCPFCADIVNGAAVSQPQRELCRMLDGSLNYPVGNRRIDVALYINNVAIAVEYDSWYWHRHKQADDTLRDEELFAAGWRILHIRSDRQLPTMNQLDVAISKLVSGMARTEITLSDWGKQ